MIVLLKMRIVNIGTFPKLRNDQIIFLGNYNNLLILFYCMLWINFKNTLYKSYLNHNSIAVNSLYY